MATSDIPGISIWIEDKPENRQRLRQAFIECDMGDYYMLETMHSKQKAFKSIDLKGSIIFCEPYSTKFELEFGK